MAVTDARIAGPGPAALAAFEHFWSERTRGVTPDRAELDERLRRRPGRIGIGVATGSRLGPYRLLRSVGDGGQGRVFDAIDERLQRRCAVKILHAVVGFSEHARERFRREGQLAARIDHPGVCRVYESGVLDEVPFLATEWIDGEPLGTWLESRRAGLGSLTAGDLRTGLDIAIAIGDALAAAHSAGVLHRDVKPSNVLMTPGGRPVVVDFGLAGDALDDRTRLTRTGQVFGTPGYMAPEQAAVVRSEPGLAARIDVFSLGVLTFELLTGRRPYAGTDRAGYEDALRRRRRDRLRDLVPDASRELATVLDRALEVEPADRVPTVADLVTALRRCRAGERSRVRGVPLGRRVRRWVAREPWLAAAAGALLAALTIGLATSLVLLDRAESARYLAGITAAAASAEQRDPGEAARWLDDLPTARRRFEWHVLHGLVTLPAIATVRDPVTRAVSAARTRVRDAAGSGWWIATTGPDGEPGNFTDDATEQIVVEHWPDGAAEPDRVRGPVALPRDARLAIEPTGAKLAIATGTRVRVLDLSGTPTDERSLSVAERNIMRLTFGPHGGILAMTDALDELQWWPSGAAGARTIRSDRRTVRTLGVDRNGSRALIVATPIAQPTRTELSIVDLESGRERSRMAIGRAVQSQPPIELPGGLIVVATDDGALAICDPATGSCRTASPPLERVAALGPTATGDLALLAPDGTSATVAATALDVGVRRRITQHAIDALVCDPNRDAWLALTGMRGAIEIVPRAAASPEPVRAMSIGRTRAGLVAVEPFAFRTRAPDGRWIDTPPPDGWSAAAACGTPIRRLLVRFPRARAGLGELAVWRPDGPTLLTKLRGLPMVRASATIAGVLAFGRTDRPAVCRLDLDTGGVHDFELESAPTALHVSPDAATILVGTADGTLVELGPDRVRRVIQVARGAIRAVTALDDGTRWLVAGDGTLRVLDAASATTVLTWPFDAASITALAVAPDDRSLAIGYEDGTITLLRADRSRTGAE